MTEAIFDLTKGVHEGTINPLEAYCILKAQQNHLETALKSLQEGALNEANKYPEKSFKMYGASIEKRAGASTFKFCSAITKEEERIKKLKEQSKIGQFADPDSGEIIEQAVKIPGKDTLAISFK